MSGFDQLAAEGPGKLKRVKRDGEEEGRLLAIGKQGFGSVPAEISVGERVCPLRSTIAQLPRISLLAVTQDDDAGRGRKYICGQQHSENCRKNEMGERQSNLMKCRAGWRWHRG